MTPKYQSVLTTFQRSSTQRNSIYKPADKFNIISTFKCLATPLPVFLQNKICHD